MTVALLLAQAKINYMDQIVFNEQLTSTNDANPLTFTFKNKVWPLDSIELKLVDAITGIGSFISPIGYTFDPDSQILALSNDPAGLLPFATYHKFN